MRYPRRSAYIIRKKETTPFRCHMLVDIQGVDLLIKGAAHHAESAELMLETRANRFQSHCESPFTLTLKVAVRGSCCDNAKASSYSGIW